MKKANCLVIAVLLTFTSPAWAQDARSVNTLFPKGDSILAGTAAGVYVTSDDGGSWKGISSGFRNSSTRAFAIITNHLYAGTEQGVNVSTDGGASWAPADPSFDKFVNSLWVDVDHNHLYAGTTTGVYRTKTYGASWEISGHWVYPRRKVNALVSAYKSFLSLIDQDIYACTDSIVYRSADAGELWRNNIFNRPVYTMYAFFGTLFAGTDSGLYISPDGGESWQPYNLRKKIFAFATHHTLVFAGTEESGAYLSNDGGIRWAERDSGLTCRNIRALLVLHDKIFAGTTNGIFVSDDDGGHWMEKDTGLR
jgi:photosystem II stability/assembly factor-like uncharacterized protein